jgi:hypothetical protein
MHSPTIAQQKAVSRALRSIVRKYPQYALTGGNGTKRLVIYEPADPLSVIGAQLTVERGYPVQPFEVRRYQRRMRAEQRRC